MAWIEVHQSLRDHRKLITFSTALNVDDAQAIGHLIYLWLWSLDNAPSGSLADLPAAIVAVAAHWKGDAERFVDALMVAGFLSTSREIHDWHDYAGKLIERREKKAAAMRQARGGTTSGIVQPRGNHVATTLPPTVPNPTQPNPTQPNQKITRAQRADDHDHIAQEFQSCFWDHWLRKVSKDRALKAWRTLNPDGELRGRIAHAVLAQNAARWQHTDPNFIPHGASWLNGRRWDDQIEPALVGVANGHKSTDPLEAKYGHSLAVSMRNLHSVMQEDDVEF